MCLCFTIAHVSTISASAMLQSTRLRYYNRPVCDITSFSKVTFCYAQNYRTQIEPWAIYLSSHTDRKNCMFGQQYVLQTFASNRPCPTQHTSLTFVISYIAHNCKTTNVCDLRYSANELILSTVCNTTLISHDSFLRTVRYVLQSTRFLLLLRLR